LDSRSADCRGIGDARQQQLVEPGKVDLDAGRETALMWMTNGGEWVRNAPTISHSAFDVALGLEPSR